MSYSAALQMMIAKYGGHAWMLTNVNGTTVKDLQPISSTDGTIGGSINYGLAGPINGEPSTGIQFPVNGIITANANSSSNVTIMCWMKYVSNLGNQVAILEVVESLSAGKTFSLYTGIPGSSVVNCAPFGHANATATVTNNAWLLAIGVYNSGTASLYINGALIQSVSTSFTGVVTGISIGKRNSSSTSAPSIILGPTATFPTAISADDIMFLYQAGINGFDTDSLIFGD